MKRALAMALLASFACSIAAAKPPEPSAPPLPMLPSVGRVKIALAKPEVIVTHDILLPKGDWKGEAIDLWIAFGAPGAPKAIDAHLLPVPDGALEASDTETGEALVVEQKPRRPNNAQPLLGKDSMAGVVVHVKKEALTKALAPGNMAALRVRAAHDLPDDDPAGGKSLIARLGVSRGTPLTLGRIVFAVPKLAKAEAKLCGPEADAHVLAFSPRLDATEPRVAPVLATRHAGDDLCVRFWLNE